MGCVVNGANDLDHEALTVAARRRWGADRAAALDDTLRRLAEAAATVSALRPGAGAEPFPTGPQPPAFAGSEERRDG